jgi:hypothetical protein
MSSLRPLFDLGLAAADRSGDTFDSGGRAAPSFLADRPPGFLRFD